MKIIIKKFDKPGVYKEVIRYGKKGEEKEWKGVVRATEGGEYNLEIRAEHEAADTRGRIVVRVVADKGAKISLTGMIKISKQAQGTDSFLDLRVLLLDEKSTATVDPKLEIEANEVKAGHAASVSKLDEEQVQYLMSRGLSESQAGEEIVNGWLSLT